MARWASYSGGSPARIFNGCCKLGLECHIFRFHQPPLMAALFGVCALVICAHKLRGGPRLQQEVMGNGGHQRHMEGCWAPTGNKSLQSCLVHA